MKFSGRVAVITGGSSGIGKATAELFAREGAAVAIVASSSRDKAKDVAIKIEHEGGKAAPFIADVCNVDSISAMVRDVLDTFERIDILVNCAGVYYPTPIGDTIEQDYDKVVDVNLKGTFFCINAIAPLLKKQGGGKIINLASASAYVPSRSYSVYAAVKAGVIMLTRALALELGPHQINVNAIAPGNTATPMNEAIRTKPEFKDLLAAMARATPSKRTYVEPEEIASVISLLASDEMRAMNGATILMDQGRTAGLIY